MFREYCPQREEGWRLGDNLNTASWHSNGLQLTVRLSSPNQHQLIISEQKCSQGARAGGQGLLYMVTARERPSVEATVETYPKSQESDHKRGHGCHVCPEWPLRQQC